MPGITSPDLWGHGTKAVDGCLQVPQSDITSVHGTKGTPRRPMLCGWRKKIAFWEEEAGILPAWTHLKSQGRPWMRTLARGHPSMTHIITI